MVLWWYVWWLRPTHLLRHDIKANFKCKSFSSLHQQTPVHINSKYCASTSKGNISYSEDRLDFPGRICPGLTFNPLSPCNETHSQSFHKARQLPAARVFSGPSLCKIYSISCLETVLFWNSAPHSILHLTDYFALPTLSPLFWLTPQLDSVFSLLFFFVCLSLIFPFLSFLLSLSISFPAHGFPWYLSYTHPHVDNSPSVWGLTRGWSTMVHLWGLPLIAGDSREGGHTEHKKSLDFFFSSPEATNDCYQLCQIPSASLCISAS